MLERPELRQLSQRIVARYHLGPLTRPEVAAYVRHRLEISGAQRPAVSGAADGPPVPLERRRSAGHQRAVRPRAARHLRARQGAGRSRDAGAGGARSIPSGAAPQPGAPAAGVLALVLFGVLGADAGISWNWTSAEQAGGARGRGETGCRAVASGASGQAAAEGCQAGSRAAGYAGMAGGSCRWPTAARSPTRPCSGPGARTIRAAMPASRPKAWACAAAAPAAGWTSCAN